MKKLFLFASIYFIFHLNQVQALPSFDPFADATSIPGGTSYTNGSQLIFQTGPTTNIWNAVTNTASPPGAIPMITTGSLSYPGLPASTGNMVSFVASNGVLGRLNVSSTVTSGNLYYSFIFRATDLSNLSSSGVFVAGFSDTSGSQNSSLSRCGTRFYTKSTTGGYLIGVAQDTGTTANWIFDPTVRTTNDVLFIVGSIEFNPGGNTTNSSLWINPDTNSFGAATPPTPTVTATAGGNLGNVKAFVLGCRSGSQIGGLADEVRVGKTWASVTGGDPAIIQQPASQNAAPGATVNLTVLANGTPTLTYQWNKNGSPLTDGGIISGSTTTNLTLSGISGGDVGSYTVVVSSGVPNSVTSAPAVLTIVDPAITTQPQSQTIDYNASAIFSVGVSGTPSFSYQWQKNGVNVSGGNISGATSANLTIGSASYLDIGSYSVNVTGGAGTATSSAATLNVRDPIINLQPLSLTKITGNSAVFSVAASGSATLSYQWKKGTTSLTNGGNISGATSANLTLTSVAPADAGSYSVTVSGSASLQNTGSSIATLTVNDPTAITDHPVSRNVAAGNPVAFGITFSGTAPITFQWYHNGGAISGATTNGYPIANPQNIDAGSYFVVVSNAYGSPVTSSTATLTVTASTTPLSQTNLIVLRDGDGAQTLATTGNTICFDQYKPDGTYVNSISVPDTGATAILIQGTSATEGALTRSINKQFLVFAGYNTNRPYSGNVANATSTNVPRAIATLDAQGSYTMQVTSSNLFSTDGIRSAVADGTNQFWASSGGGNTSRGGTRYFGPNGTNVQIQNTSLNHRVLEIFNGDLYFSAAAGTFGIHKMTGLPTNLVTETTMIDETTNAYPYDFAINSNTDVLYVTDDGNANASSANPAGIIKWTNNAGTWVSNYTLISGTAVRGLEVDFSANPPVLYATTTETNISRLLKVTDTGAAASFTTLATAGPNTLFRGVKFGPIAASVAAPTLVATHDSSNIVLSWNGAFFLQSSTNVNGPYTDTGGTNPYTNALNSASRRFFRLRN